MHMHQSRPPPNLWSGLAFEYLEQGANEVVVGQDADQGLALEPSTDEELAEYAAECASANAEKCEACFTGPAIAGCASFLCRRDVAKLLARINALTAERDELRARLLETSGGG